MNSSKTGSPIKDWLANETGNDELPEYSENKSQASCHVSEDSHNSQVNDSKGTKMDQESKSSCQECLLSHNEEISSDFKNEAGTSIAKSLYAEENELQKETTMLELPTTVFDAEMLKMAEILIPERKIALINSGSEPDNETVDNEVPECSDNKSQDSCQISEDAHGIPANDSEDMTKMNQKSKITCKDSLPLQKKEIFSDSEKEKEIVILALKILKDVLQMEATKPELPITYKIKILEIAKKFFSKGKMALINRLLESERETGDNDEVPECYEHKSLDSCHASQDSNRTPVKDSAAMKVNYESTIACKEFLSSGNEDFKNKTEATAAKPLDTKTNNLQTESTAPELSSTTAFNEEVLEMAKMLKISEGKISLISRLLELNDSTEATEAKARMTAEEVMKESDECGRLPYLLGSLVIGHVKASITDNTKTFASSKLEIPEPSANENCQASKLETEDKEQTNEHVEKNDSKFPSNVGSSAKSKRKKKKKKNKNKNRKK